MNDTPPGAEFLDEPRVQITDQTFVVVARRVPPEQVDVLVERFRKWLQGADPTPHAAGPGR